MPKVVKLSDHTNEALLEELTKRLGATAAAGEDGVEEFPSPDAIDEMESEGLHELCEKIDLEYEDVEDDDLKTHLKILHAIGSDDTDDLDADEVKALCLALGMKPSGKIAKNIEAIKAYLDKSDGAEETEEAEAEDTEEEAAEETEEEEVEESDEDEEEKPKKKKKKADDDEDAEEEDAEEEDAEETEEEEASDEEESEEEETEEVDTAAVVKKSGKYPGEADMKKRLDAFNKVAKKKLDAKKLGGVKKAYAKLLELMVDHAGEIAKWGTPYIREDTGWCCGLEMPDAKFKGDKTEYGKCAVTGKYYSLDEEGSFVEKE